MRRLALAAVGAAAILMCGAGQAVAAEDDVLSVPVGFAVQNVNGSGAACQSDGNPYTLHAELVGPRSVLTGGAPATATLYLHEYSFDDFWHFRTVPGVDYATAMAEAGHVSATLDRLGYDDSPRPDGMAMCIGAHADMAHQIVQQLRAGAYQPEGIAPRAFQRIVLGGHSVGAVIAELEAYSFGDVDALALFGHTDGDYSSESLQVGVRQGTACGHGGDAPDAPNYAYFGTPEESRALAYRDADPAVVEAQATLRHPDPCGDVNSLIPVLATNQRRAGEVKVPVLLVYGKQDATLAADAPDKQSQRYTGSDDVSVASFDNASHALLLERVAPQVQATVSLWLAKHGFSPPGSSPPSPSGGSRPAPLLRVVLRGHRRRGCARHNFTLKVRVLARGVDVRSTTVTLDGRVVARTRSRGFPRRIPVRRLSPGSHVLVATARDASGATTRAVARFRRC